MKHVPTGTIHGPLPHIPPPLPPPPPPASANNPMMHQMMMMHYPHMMGMMGMPPNLMMQQQPPPPPPPHLMMQHTQAPPLPPPPLPPVSHQQPPPPPLMSLMGINAKPTGSIVNSNCPGRLNDEVLKLPIKPPKPLFPSVADYATDAPLPPQLNEQHFESVPAGSKIVHPDDDISLVT